MKVVELFVSFCGEKVEECRGRQGKVEEDGRMFVKFVLCRGKVEKGREMLGKVVLWRGKVR